MKKPLAFLVFILLAASNVFAQAGGGNYLPGAQFILNNRPFNDTIIELFPGDSLHLVINTFDSDPNDSVILTSDAATVLAGASFSVSNTVQQRGILRWVAPAGIASYAPKAVLLQMADNGAPIKGINNLRILIRINPVAGITRNSAPVNLNQEIVLLPGEPLNLRLSSVNSNITDSISLTSNVAAMLPNATFSVDNAKQQTATINWTPTSAHIRAQVYTFQVRLHDKGNPLSVTYPYTIKLRVGSLMAVSREAESLPGFAVYPNPFRDQVHFKFDAGIPAETQLVIYNALGQEMGRTSLSQQTGSREFSWEKAAELPAGTYLARLISGNKISQTLKFIKLK